jgi:DNA-binding MarR family transcriptional regulator
MTTLRLAEFLPYRLSLASNAVSGRIARAYQARFGLSIPEWRVLAVVAEGAGTQAQLVERTAMDKMTVSRAVARLVARGLLARGTAADRRTIGLALSDEGRQLHAEVAPAALRMEAEILTGFSEAERRQLAAMLERLERCAGS